MSGCHPIDFNKVLMCLKCERYLELCICNTNELLQERFVKMQEEYDKQERKLNKMREELNRALMRNRVLDDKINQILDLIIGKVLKENE